MRIKNLPSIESMDGSQDALVIEQTDGSEDKSRKVSPAQLKQYVQTGDFEATGEVKDGHGNILKDMAKSDDVDEVIGNLSQTGLTGDSVAEQLDTAREQIATKQDTLTIVDISSQATVDTSKVSSFKGYTYGKLIYISLVLKPGVTDQSNVVAGLPTIIPNIGGNYGVLPMFHMNAVDASSNGVCAYVGTSIQYRGSTTSGTTGTVYSGMFLLA